MAITLPALIKKNTHVRCKTRKIITQMITQTVSSTNRKREVGVRVEREETKVEAEVVETRLKIMIAVLMKDKLLSSFKYM